MKYENKKHKIRKAFNLIVENNRRIDELLFVTNKKGIQSIDFAKQNFIAGEYIIQGETMPSNLSSPRYTFSSQFQYSVINFEIDLKNITEEELCFVHISIIYNPLTEKLYEIEDWTEEYFADGIDFYYAFVKIDENKYRLGISVRIQIKEDGFPDPQDPKYTQVKYLIYKQNPYNYNALRKSKS